MSGGRSLSGCQRRRCAYSVPSFDCDYHIHTVHCGHASPEMTAERIVETARRRGLGRIVILEHVPNISAPAGLDPERWKKGRNDRSEIDRVIEEVGVARRGLDGIEVIIGAEIDPDPFRPDGSLMLDDLDGIELVVASTHLFPGGSAFWYTPFAVPADAREKVAREWFSWAGRIVENDRVQVLAHPGALLAARGAVHDFGEYAHDFARLGEKMRASGVAFELNELFHDKVTREGSQTYAQAVRSAREGGAVFTVGSDAHRPERIGRFDLTRRLFKRAGLGEDDFWHPSARGGVSPR